ncbi:MAG: MIP family channel protein [Chloroflexi bacterium]|nr:MIP family channel protein [Chloroflexota bacterium]
MTSQAQTSELFDINAWRDSLAEFVATMLFIFIGCGSVVASGIATGGTLDAGRLVAIALAHGIAITLLVFATAHISGGHINPAVTVGAIITKKITPIKGGMFIVMQLAGAIVGALLLWIVAPEAAQGNLGAHGLGTDVSVGMGLLTEIILTFLLVFVIFAAAMDKRGAGALAPIAIGFAVMAAHLVAVPLTGAGIKPARSLGPAVFSGAWADHWIYWVGPLLGGGLAASVYQALFASDRNGSA